MHRFRAASLAFSVLLLQTQVAGFAQSAPRNLNLSSSLSNVVAKHSGTITTNGSQQQVVKGQLITPSQSVALSQVVFSPGGTQSLILGTAGNATGGSFDISLAGKNGASNVVIPQGVTAIQDAAKLANLNISQSLINAGVFQIVSTNAAAKSASISAMSILNQQSGVITSILPPGGLPGFAGASSNVGLNLNAVSSVVNHGVISSSGNLSVNAASIENVLPAGMAGPSPVMQAQGDLNMVANTVQNSGLISSLNSNINIGSQFAQNLVVNSTGGVLQALNGVINVGDALATGLNTSITGGDFVTPHLNVFAACADAQVHPRSLTGDVNIIAGSTHVSTDVGNLTVGSLVASGDPEMDTPGDLVVNGIQAPGQPITLIAGGNVTINPSGPLPADYGLDALNFSGAGGDILVVAGADFTTSSGNVIITGGTPAGGSITLNNSTYAGSGTFVRTGGTTTPGKVTMVAYGGSGGGQFTVTDTSTGKSVIQDDGGITIIAPNGISTGNLLTSANNSKVVLANSQPSITNGPVIVTQATGQVTQGSFEPGTTGTGGIQLLGTGFTSADGALEVRAGSGGFSSSHTMNADTMTVTSLSTISFTGTGNSGTRAGALIMVAQDGITSTHILADSGILDPAVSGDIVLIAGASFTETANSITITGASAGNTSGLDLNTANTGTASVTSRADSAGDSGGKITILSYAGSSGSAAISLGAGSNGKVLSGGNGAGTTNGDITIVSAQNTGAAITGGIINSTGGDAGSGNVTLASETPATGLVISKATGAITGDVLGGTLKNGSFSPQSVTIDNSDITFHGAPLTDVPSYTGTADRLSIKSGSNFAPASAISAGSLDVQTTGTVNLSNALTLSNNIAITASDSITVNTDLVAPGGILLVSGHNVTTGTAGLDIDASSSSSNGGNITVVAGAQFTELGDTLTITGKSVTGGMIDFKTSALSNLTTSSSDTDGTAGALTLVAFAGTDNTGNVSVAGSIATGGDGTGANGDLVVVAGKTSGTSIDLPAIDTTGGKSGTGNISLHATTPNTTPSVDISKSTAKVTGDFTGGAVQNAVVSVTSISIDDADITIESGGTPVIGPITGTVRTYNVSGNDINVTSPINVENLNLRSTNNITIGADINAEHAVLLSKLDINLNANITAPGGILLVSSRSINSAAGTPISLSSNSNTAGAGNITLVAGAQFTETGNTVTITAGSPSGDISLNSANFKGITAVSTLSGGNGGNINVIALSDGSNPGSGLLNFSSSLGLASGGAGAGKNGNITLVAARGDSGVSINLPTGSTIDASGGSGGSGNVTLRGAAPSFNIDLSEVTCDVSAGSFTGGTLRNGLIDNHATVTLGSGQLLAQSAGRIDTLGAVTGGSGSSVDIQSGNLAQLAALSVGNVSVTAVSDINLNGDITAPAGLILVSSTNVNSIAANLKLSTASATGDASDMTIVAGAAFTQTGSSVTISGPSTGGTINFNSSPDLNSASSFAGGDGGDITLIGLASTGLGIVTLGIGSDITTGGTGTGSNGNLIVVGNRNDTGSTVTLQGGSTFNTAGGAAGTGDVTIRSAAPDFTTAVVIDKATGGVTTGSFTGGTVTSGLIDKQSGTILTMDGGKLSVTSNFNINMRGTNTVGTGGAVAIQTGNTLLLGQTSAGSISATASVDLNIEGSLTAPIGMVLVAGQNVGTTVGGLTLSTASATGDAGDMTIVAGAAFTQNGTAVTISGPSTGGTINFNSSPDLTSSSSFTGGDGGDMTLVALASSGAGIVTIGIATDISTGGNGTGSNGSLIIVGNRNDTGSAVTLQGGGTISTTGGAAGTGDVTILSAAPDFTTAVVVDKATGAVTAGSFTGGTLKSGFVDKQSGTTLTMDGGNLSVASGFHINLRGTNTVGSGTGTVAIQSGTTVLLGQTSAGSISSTAGVDLNIEGSLTAPSGMVLVAGQNVSTTAGGLTLSTASSTGDAGDMTIVAGALFTQNGTTVTITGPVTSGGGTINFNSSPDLTSSSSFAGGDGGNITMIGLTSATSPGNGIVTVGTTTDISTGGNGTGSNGSLTIVGSRTDTGNAITLQGGSTINTAGGASGTGAVTLRASVPDFTTAVVIDKATGGVTAGSFTGGTLTNGLVEKQNGTTLTMNGGTLNAATNNRVDILGTNNLGLGTGVVSVEAGTLVQLGTITTGGLTATTTSGSISVVGSLLAPNGLTLVAGQNVSTGTGVTISTSSSTGNAGNLTVVAGATFTQTPTEVKITGEATSGGTITVASGSKLDASSTFPGGNGGEMSLVAYSSTTNPGQGVINLDPSVPVLAGGNGSGANGSVTIVAGRNDGNFGFFHQGSVNVSGGATGTGAITIQAARFNGAVDIDKSSGGVTSGSFAGGPLANGQIQVTTLVLPPGGDLDIETASTLHIPSGTYSVDGSGVDADGGSITLVANIYNIQGGGNLNLSADATGNGKGGTISVTTLGSNIIVGNDPGEIMATADGTDGSITFHASGNVTVNDSLTADFITLQSDNLALGGGVFINAPVTANNTLNIITRNLTNNSALTGGVLLNINSPSGSPLDMFGTGTFTSGLLTNVTADTGDLTFHAGKYDFIGTTNLNALKGDVVLLAGAIVTGFDQLNVNINSLNTAPGSSITGNPLHFAAANGAGTIANSSGDVILPDKLVFSGLSLAVLASGNILSSKLATIDLTSKTGDGGSLTMIAGFDFTPTTVGQVGPVNTQFTLGAPSSSGGSVLLPKVSIKTSTTAAGKIGGSITVIAHSGNVNAGMISLKALTTSGTAAGSGSGSIMMIGQGGVQVGAITTKGSQGGNVTVLGATPSTVGTVTIEKGQLVGIFKSDTPSIANGAGILVSGAISTVGTAGNGGKVVMDADSQVEVTAGITTTAQTTASSLSSRSGGLVSLRSRNSNVSVKGIINTSALSAKTALGAGNAGDIKIQAMSYINTGALKAIGANNTGTGAGGNGGKVDLLMEHITAQATSQAFGAIKVSGIIDVHGGNGNPAKTSTATSNGGNGGKVTIDAGTFVGTGGGVSINAAAGLKGKNGTSNGAAGDVAIATFALQQMPDNMDLTSTKASINTLPGGMFTVGLASPVNGVSGSIVADVTVNNKSNNGFNNGQFVADFNPSAKISIDLTNVSGTPTIGATGAIVTAAGVRNKVTPAQAVNLFATSRNGAAPFVLTAENAFASQSVPTVSFDQKDLNGTTFTAFKIPAGANLTFTGERPVLNLPAATLLGGTLNFASTIMGVMNLGSGAMKIETGAKVDATGSTLMLSGTGGTWTNNGQLLADNLLFARPSAAPLTFVTGDGATTQASQILLAPSIDVGMTFTIKANAAKSATVPVNLGNVLVPAIYKANATAAAANVTVARALKLTFAESENVSSNLQAVTQAVGGTFSGKTVTINGALSTATIAGNTQKVQTPVTISNGSSFTASGAIALTTTASKLTVGNGVTMTSTTGSIALSAKSKDPASDVAIGNNGNFTATTSLTVTGDDTLSVGNSNSFTAGQLGNSPPAMGAGLLLATNIIKKGSITFTGTGATSVNGISIGDSNIFTNNGAKLSVTVKAGDMQIGNSNQFLARGGNLVMLALGNVAGGTLNQFKAQGVVNTSTGGVELGAGTTSSTIAGDFSKASGTRIGTTNILGFTDLSPGKGAIVLNPSTATTVNLATVGPNSTITLLGGPIKFNAINGAKVELQGSGAFQSEASKPISFTTTFQGETEVIVDTGDDDSCIDDGDILVDNSRR